MKETTLLSSNTLEGEGGESEDIPSNGYKLSMN